LRLIAGCPVANRAWSLPRWFERVAAQTRRPDGLVFVHAGDDETLVAVYREAARHGFAVTTVADEQPPRPRHDNERFRTLTNARNDLLRTVQHELDADLLLSLDSDIMLEDPETIERLERLVVEDGYDLASPVAFLHPAAPSAWSPAEPACWAYNAGFWPPTDTAVDETRRPWVRSPVDAIPWGARVEIDIPMAVWLGNRQVIDCRYQWHDQGEDVGFAQDLERHGLRCVWDTGMYAWHCWEPRVLEVDPYLPPSECWAR
jgi:hypothetical protein